MVYSQTVKGKRQCIQNSLTDSHYVCTTKVLWYYLWPKLPMLAVLNLWTDMAILNRLSIALGDKIMVIYVFFNII